MHTACAAQSLNTASVLPAINNNKKNTFVVIIADEIAGTVYYLKLCQGLGDS